MQEHSGYHGSFRAPCAELPRRAPRPGRGPPRPRPQGLQPRARPLPAARRPLERPLRQVPHARGERRDARLPSHRHRARELRGVPRRRPRRGLPRRARVRDLPQPAGLRHRTARHEEGQAGLRSRARHRIPLDRAPRRRALRRLPRQGGARPRARAEARPRSRRRARVRILPTATPTRRRSAPTATAAIGRRAGPAAICTSTTRATPPSPSTRPTPPSPARAATATARFGAASTHCEGCHTDAAALLSGRVRGHPPADADPHHGKVECAACHRGKRDGAPLVAAARACVECHAPEYGALLLSRQRIVDGLLVEGDAALRALPPASGEDARARELRELAAELDVLGRSGAHHPALAETIARELRDRLRARAEVAP